MNFISLRKATTQAEDEAEYRKQMAAFHEPQHPLYGDCPVYY
jgi:hypothetical protein